MATWSYRVVRHFFRGVGDEVLDEWYAIHEAYPGNEDENQPEAITVTPVMISGETPEVLKAMYAAMFKAFEEPILDECVGRPKATTDYDPKRPPNMIETDRPI